MYNIIYNKNEEQVDSKEKVMTLVTNLIEQQIDGPEFIIIETEAHGAMEIARGLGDETILFYIPESEEDDVKVSCNKSVDRAKSPVIKLGHPTDEYGVVNCTVSNTVPIEKGLKVLRNFLEGEVFIDIVDWYCC